MQRSTANAYAANVLNVFTVTLHDRRARAHAHHNHAVELGLITRTKTVCYKLFCLLCGQIIYRLIDVSATHTREHDLLNVLKLYLVYIQKFSKSAVERCHGVCGLDTDWRQHLSLLHNSHNLCCAYANVNAYYYSHNS